MAELKIKENNNSVMNYLNTIEDEQRKKDCVELLELFSKTTGQVAKIWGKDIVGFGSYHYKGKSGREGEWFPLGFSSRKANLTIYMPAGFKNFEKELAEIGKHKVSAGCLYVKSLEGIDKKILKELAKKAYLKMTTNNEKS